MQPWALPRQCEESDTMTAQRFRVSRRSGPRPAGCGRAARWPSPTRSRSCAPWQPPALALFKNPVGAAAANTRLAIGLAAALRATAERTMGSDAPGPVSPAAGDKRFLDAAYADNPLYFLLEQQYLLNSQLVARAARRGRVAGSSGRQGALRGAVHPRRARAHQHPAGQPCRAPRRPSTPAARAWCGARGTCSATSATTADGRRRSTAPASRWASTWRRPRAPSSTAAT